MFNPYSVKDIDSTTVEIFNPDTGVETGAKVTIANAEHPQAKAAAFEINRKRRRQLKRTGRDMTEDPEAMQTIVIDTMVSRTLGWSGFCDDNGKELPFSEENVREIYTHALWLRKQVFAAMTDDENFTKGSAKP